MKALLAILALFFVPIIASAQNGSTPSKNSDLAGQLDYYKGPFEIVQVSTFVGIVDKMEPTVAIAFKCPDGKIAIATIFASSIDIMLDQAEANPTNNEDTIIVAKAPHLISFTFNNDLIEQVSWRMIDHPAKFITTNHMAVRAEIHCPSSDMQKYLP